MRRGLGMPGSPLDPADAASGYGQSAGQHRSYRIFSRPVRILSKAIAVEHGPNIAAAW